MIFRRARAPEWRFLMSPDDEALLRAILPADSLAPPRPPNRWKLWLSLALPPLLAAGAALYRYVLHP
jgi:hypothetical protein